MKKWRIEENERNVSPVSAHALTTKNHPAKAGWFRYILE